MCSNITFKSIFGYFLVFYIFNLWSHKLFLCTHWAAWFLPVYLTPGVSCQCFFHWLCSFYICAWLLNCKWPLILMWAISLFLHVTIPATLQLFFPFSIFFWHNWNNMECEITSHWLPLKSGFCYVSALRILKTLG